MDLRALEYFLAVARVKNFRRAAEHLHLSQPGLSQQIAKLEKDVGTKLFVRYPRGVELTEPGRLLIPLAQRVLADLTHARNIVHKASIGEYGALRISFVYSAAFSVLPRVVSEIQDILPEVEMHFTEDITDTQLEKIGEGTYDIGIVRGASRVPENLVSFPLLTERLVLVVHSEHRLADQKRVRMTDLMNEPIMTSPRASALNLYDQIAGLCQNAGFLLRPALIAVQFPTLVGLVAAQRGVAILPESMHFLKVPNVRYLPIDDRLANSTLSLIAREDRAKAPGLNLVMNRFTELQ